LHFSNERFAALMKKMMVLLNTGAGSAHPSPVEGDIKAHFAEHGIDATIRSLPGAKISAAAKEFADQHHGDFDALVVGGGDGSVSAAAAALAGGDIPLGVLPLGTLNHFAKDLAIPLDLPGAVATIAAGALRRVDVAELNGRIFINNSSIGLYPFMVARRNEEQRRLGRSKLAATFPAAMRALMSNAWHHLGIEAEGERKRVRTPCIFVGNNPYQVGLGHFGTRASLEGGELCVHVVRQQSRLGVLLLPFKVALGLADPLRDVETFTAPDVEITSRKRRLHVSLDGEVAMVETPLRYRIRPRALSVLAPPSIATPG
jgi:diacylglycerol kinase family enzyme